MPATFPSTFYLKAVIRTWAATQTRQTSRHAIKLLPHIRVRLGKLQFRRKDDVVSEEEHEFLEQVDTFLSMPNQSWLFGAGISYEAGIPLMYPLTARVLELAKGGPAEEILATFKAELPDNCHIEHLLSHLGDYCALAERSKDKAAPIGGKIVKLDELEAAHNAILQHIGDTVRWGYKKAVDDSGAETWTAGKREAPLVKVDDHVNFAHAIFRRNQAGLQQRRGPVRIFTTNYDTLIEDGLALSGITYWDGFAGGAIAFRSHRFGEPEPSGAYRAHIIKLHGSIDWHISSTGEIYRIRDGDLYPERSGRVLIYPQSTKYVATQRDPFAAQFELLRRTLSSQSDNVLCTCGYSFGDDHINQELELGLSRLDSKTTLIAFLMEGGGLPDCLQRWRHDTWGQRLYIVTENGIYAGAKDIACRPAAGAARDWWTFTGVTKALINGLGSRLR